MPQTGFETTIPVFERTKTVHALDRAAAVIGYLSLLGPNISLTNLFLNIAVICPYLNIRGQVSHPQK
jgi:hypothetical protein